MGLINPIRPWHFNDDNVSFDVVLAGHVPFDDTPVERHESMV